MLRFFILTCCLLTLSGCLQKQKIADIPEAENQLLTNDGRYFVTAGSGIYEMQNNQALKFGPSCAYAGIMQAGDYLLTVCSQLALINSTHKVYYAKLIPGQQPQLTLLTQLNNMSLPNGMALQDAKHLLIADYNVLGTGKIARLTFHANSAGQLIPDAFEASYLNSQQGIYSANGLRMQAGRLYFTDWVSALAQSRVGYLDFDPQGNPGSAHILHSQAGIIDDLLPACGGVLAADYLNGRLLFINAAGELFKSSLQQFPGLSSIMQGDGRHARTDQLLVTERGILFDSITPIGNQLSLVDIDPEVLTRTGAQCQP